MSEYLYIADDYTRAERKMMLGDTSSAASEGEGLNPVPMNKKRRVSASQPPKSHYPLFELLLHCTHFEIISVLLKRVIVMFDEAHDCTRAVRHVEGIYRKTLKVKATLINNENANEYS